MSLEADVAKGAPTITEFLLERIAEDEVRQQAGPPTWDDDEPDDQLDRWNATWHTNICGWRTGEGLDRVCGCDVQGRVLAECAAKRAIITFHESWPVLVEKPTELPVPAPSDLNAMVYRMTAEIGWFTQQEYVKRFGVDPPTTPMLQAMALVYADHPDYQMDWSL